MVAVHGLGPDDAVLMPAPLAHVSGLLNGVLIASTAGIPTVLMAAWDPDEGLRRIEEERVSFMGAPPIFFSQMAAASGFRRERVRSLRLVSTGGASVSPAFVDATSESFGCRVKRTYGSTEAPTVTTSGPDDSVEKARDTDGRALGDVELEVHDPDTSSRMARAPSGRSGCGAPSCSPAMSIPISRPRCSRTGGVGSAPGTSGSSTPRVGCGWWAGSRTPSSAPARTSRPRRSRPCSRPIRMSATPWPWPCPTPRWASGRGLRGGHGPLRPGRLPGLVRRARGVTRFKTPEMVVQLDALPVLAAGKPDRSALRAMADKLRSGE